MAQTPQPPGGWGSGSDYLLFACGDSIYTKASPTASIEPEVH